MFGDTSSITTFIKGLNLNKILSGTNKTLNFVKQAIPIYQEVRPIITNTKNIFSKKDTEVKKEILKTDRPLIKSNNIKKNIINDSLTFFQ